MDNEQELASQIDAWLNAPAVSSHAQLGGAGATPIVSSAILVGKNAQKALANAQAYREADDADDEERAFQIFKSDYASACSTILDIARRASGYDPTRPNAPGNKEKFADYLSRVQKAPFFFLTYAEKETIQSQSKSYDGLIDAIADTFQGLVEENRKAVVNALAGLAKVAANTESTRQTKDLFVQNVIQAEDKYNVFLYTCHVDMESATKKGISEKQSLFEVSTTKLELKKSLWPSQARKVYDIWVMMVDDWMEKNSTPAEEDSYKLCLTERA